MSDLIRNPLIVALDMDSAEEALQLAESICGQVGAFKVGPRLTLRYGRDLLEKLAEMAPLFLDHKYYDIPSTMESAIRAAHELGATLVTIHTQAGSPAMHRLAKVEKELSQIRPFKILGVTILTSFNQEDLPGVMAETPISQHVEYLATLAQEAGLSGLVCSPHEAGSLREMFSSAFLVTPGVRFAEGGSEDQVRVMTPGDAIRAGSSAIVMGRPIIESPSPKETVKRVLEEIAQAQEAR